MRRRITLISAICLATAFPSGTASAAEFLVPATAVSAEQPPTGPDLQVTYAGAALTSLPYGGSIWKVYATVKNVGTTATVLPSYAALKRDGGYISSPQLVPPLSVGQSRYLTFVPGVNLNECHVYTVTADSTNWVSEINETNNVRSVAGAAAGCPPSIAFGEVARYSL